MITETDITADGAPLLEIDWQHQVHRIVDFILHSESRLNVLHGRPNSGKTELIRQWVIPALRAMKDAGEIWYGDCAPDFPGVVEGAPDEGEEPQYARFEALTHRKSIVFIDTFGHIFEGPREARRAVLDEVFGKLQQPDAQTRIVLVTDSKHLTSIYGLGVYDPRIVDAVFDIGSIPLTDALLQLAAAQPYGSPQYSDAVLDELARDGEALDKHGVGVTFDLLNILDNVFRASPSWAQHVEQYKSAGRLSGILRNYLDKRLKQIANGEPNSEAIARGILERVAECHTQGIAFNSEDLLARLAVSQEGFNATLQMLLAQNLLREVAPGSYLPVPLQLTTILEQDLAEHRQVQDRITNVLEEALRSWSIVGSLLPPTRFAEIHGARRQLLLSNEHTRFMLYNALRYADATLEDAAYYWLRRINNRSEGADVLLASLFSDNADVRRRAAGLLRRYPETDVRTRLHAVALTDPDERVRAQAVASLEPMKTDGLMNELLSVVKEEKSNYRIHAIETLKLFKDPRVTDALSELVRKKTSEPPVRKNAIGVLGAMNTVESVDALLEIAATDDDHDRQEASAALGRPSSGRLVRHILQKLDAPTKIVRARMICAVLTMVVLVIAAPVQIGLWSIFNAIPTVWKFVAFALVAGGLVLTSRLLLKIRSGEIKRGSLGGMFAIVLFFGAAVSVGFVVHGLPQALIKQWPRAIKLVAVEVLAIALVVTFMSAANLPGWMVVLGLVYFWGGYFLFLGTYATGVFALLFGTVIYRDRLVLIHRRNEVYRSILSDPDAARLIFNDLDSTDPIARNRARKLLNRFGAAVPGQVLTELLQSESATSRRFATRVLIKTKSDETVSRLGELWADANSALKRRIAAILCRQPTSSSVEALTALRKKVPFIQRTRFKLAELHYRTAVWPRAARVVLVIVAPLIGMVVYHGVQVVRNPAWGQIITLGIKKSNFVAQFAPEALNPLREAEALRNRIAAAEVAAAHYPSKSADHLLRIFRDRKHERDPRVQAALARGLVLLIDSTFTSDDPRRAAVQRELVRQAGFFENLIADSSDSVSVAAIAALRAMANSRDTVLWQTGTRILQQFVFTPGRTGAEDPVRIHRAQAKVISELGSLDAARAFTAMRAILDTTGEKHGPAVRLQQTRVAERAYANLVERQTYLRTANLIEREAVTEMQGLNLWSKDLLKFYESMKPKPTRLIDELKRWIDEVGDCDRTGDMFCDQLDYALTAIAAAPDAESGYRQIYDYYAGIAEYQKAFERFESLKREHPNSVWPYKLLAEITHEYLEGTPQQFQRSFEEMTELRRLDAFARLSPDDQRRFLADFAEIALSAGKYEDLKTLADETVHGSENRGYKLNMVLFLYAGEVMQRNRANAQTRLAELEKVVQSLPKQGFYNNWIYPGTRKLFEGSDLPPDVKAGLLELCREGAWYSPAEAAAVIDRNRKALAQLN